MSGGDALLRGGRGVKDYGALIEGHGGKLAAVRRPAGVVL